VISPAGSAWRNKADAVLTSSNLCGTRPPRRGHEAARAGEESIAVSSHPCAPSCPRYRSVCPLPVVTSRYPRRPQVIHSEIERSAGTTRARAHCAREAMNDAGPDGARPVGREALRRIVGRRLAWDRRAVRRRARLRHALTLAAALVAVLVGGAVPASICCAQADREGPRASRVAVCSPKGAAWLPSRPGSRPSPSRSVRPRSP
jgi:hypothetical protein